MNKIFEVAARAELLAVPPGVTGQSDWLVVTQEMVDGFADVTGDHQWIHVDRERAARELPSGGTIAHGFLTLSLLPQLLEASWTVDNERQSLNYGAERLRFISPVPTGSRIRLNTRLVSVEEREQDDGLKLAIDCGFELEGQPKPALALTVLAIFYFDR
ncbi:MaoC family dehydratase [Sphingosinicella microcystinivorans]|uniref:Acyl dehydratase n=1 Tax=Sphingosinicella microcystinivorans TaxID=335406 RepID=A0AAD1G047_SPHMI|nr:MaoC family dehydratase [Sphingosinicella microcystinivorans]RKS85441.1 acyl dehydratase [Sphingosinicella microcystinivorans]BBE33269.1 putative enoyl-CoA hydratase 1 [Sphingosinicella microcystinivorans]